MAQNITLLGASYSNVPAVELPKTGGGTASFTDVTDTTATASDVAQGKYFYLANGTRTEGTGTGGGGGSVTQDQDGFIVLPPTGGGGGGGNWSWMGENPTKVSTIVSEKEYLENTAYATWTPSTTSTTLSASTTLTAVTGLDFSSYDYILYGKFHTHYEYGQGATGTAQPADYYANVTPVAFGVFTNLSSMNSGTTNSTTYMNTSVASGLFYKNTSGADAFTTSYYGVYVSGWDAISSLTSGNIIPRTPKISAMCSNNQFSTTNASAVDQTKSYYEYKLELWRVDAGTSHIYYYSRGIRDMWLNGF